MRGVRIVLIVLVVLVTIGCVNNVFTDDSAVRAQAEAVGCPRGGCTKASAMKISRTPIAETVEYTMPDGTLSIRCARAAVFVGPYTCVKE